MESKISDFLQDSRYVSLSGNDKESLNQTAEQLRLSWQDINYLLSLASDLQIWQEESLSGLIEFTGKVPENLKGKNRKQYVLKRIREKENELRNSGGDYSHFEKARPENKSPVVEIDSSSDLILLGTCPVESEKTRCCRLQTLDAVLSCGFDCSYCSIQ